MRPAEKVMAPGPAPQRRPGENPHWVGGLGVLCTGAVFARLGNDGLYLRSRRGAEGLRH